MASVDEVSHHFFLRADSKPISAPIAAPNRMITTAGLKLVAFVPANLRWMLGAKKNANTAPITELQPIDSPTSRISLLHARQSFRSIPDDATRPPLGDSSSWAYCKIAVCLRSAAARRIRTNTPRQKVMAYANDEIAKS